jgi:hypothetical protein
MPESQGGYGFEEAPPSPAEKLKGVAKPLGDLVKRVGPKRIGLLGLLLVVAYLYFFVLPRPGTLTVRVLQLDVGTPIPGAEVTVSGEGGGTVSGSTEDNGEAVLRNVPTGQSLSVSVDVGGRYGPAVSTVELESGGERTLTVNVPLRKKLEIVGTVPSVVLSPRCTKAFNLEVKNNGEESEDVEFVADGLTSPLEIRSERKSVPPGGTEVVSFTLVTNEAAPKSRASGRARIKFTNTGVSLSFPIDEAPKVEVSPSDVSCSQPSCSQVVTLKNSGRSTVSDVMVTTRGSESLLSRLRFEGIEPPLVVRELPPGAEAKFALVIENTDVGTFTGFADIEATCFSKSISVKSDRRT